MTPFILFGAIALAAVVSYVLTPAAGWLSGRLGAIDHPGERKVHQVPIPRLGGLAVLASVAITATAILFRGYGLPQTFTAGLALGVLPIIVVSVIDDVRSVPALVKFLAHGLAAAIAVAYGFSLGGTIHVLGVQISIAAVALPLSWCWIVGVTNAFNLSDGLDGLSAGLALISAISLAAVAVVLEDPSQAVMSAILVGALIGFLPFNMFPAKIFFGDTGAASIGFILACLSLWGTSRLSSGIAVIVPILVMGVPVADAAVTIIRRSMKPLVNRDAGGDLFKADQEHIHHRLLRKGFEHKDAVLILYAVGVTIALVGVASLFMASQSVAIVVVTLLVAAAMGIRELDYDELAIVRNGLVLRMYNIPALRTGAFRVFIDIALVGIAVYGTFALKFDEWDLSKHRQVALDLIVVLVPLTLLVFVAFGLYRRSWRFSRLPDLIRTVAAIVVVDIAGFLVSRLLGEDAPSVAFFVIYALVSGAMVLALRMSFRLFLLWKGKEKATGARVIVYGAGHEGALALNELFWNSGLQPVGFIDDDPKNVGRLVNGFRVFGDVNAIERVVRENAIDGLVVGSWDIDGDRLAEVIEACARSGVWLKRFQLELRNLPTGEVSDDIVEPAAESDVPTPVPVLVPMPVVVVAASIQEMIDDGAPEDRRTCARCGQLAYRSRARNQWERFKKRVSSKRIYRCAHCQWRGWAVPLTSGEAIGVGGAGVPDLARLDAVVTAGAASQAHTREPELE